MPLPDFFSGISDLLFRIIELALLFVISGPKDLQVSSLYWIRHFKFFNFDFRFIISDPKNLLYQKMI